ncbi:MAG: flagellar basal body-associated FliL family protein [Deltaproteobacteria bacterium]|nr:flagellar basal body-associated FliL family protein [Deltaproteobacteria bacterium]
MAEEIEKEEGEDGSGAAEQPAGKSKKKLILIIAASVIGLALVIGVPVLLFVSKGGDHKEISELDEEAAQHAKLLPEGHADEEELLEGEEPLGAFFPFDTFIVNLEGGGYLRLQAQVEFHGRDVPQRFYSRITLARDALITLLSSRSAKDLQSKRDKEELKNEIKDVVNEILRKEEVKKVYFTQFLIQ